LTLLGLGLVQAASARALVEIDAGRSVAPLRAYRLTADSVAPLFGALLIAALVVSLLASSLFLIPIAIWLAGRWALLVPAIELEGVSAIGGLRRSGRLVGRRWLKVSSLIVAGGALAILVGPLIGMLLILGTDAPFWLVNVVAGVVYAVTMPFVALTTAYAYFDARVRDELAGERASAELPAEIGLSG
jgi:predicted membrane metal-binding protein